VATEIGKESHRWREKGSLHCHSGETEGGGIVAEIVSLAVGKERELGNEGFQLWLREETVMRGKNRKETSSEVIIRGDSHATHRS